MMIFKPLFVLGIRTNGAPAKCEKRKGVCTGIKLVQPECQPTDSIPRKQLACNMPLDLNAVLKE